MPDIFDFHENVVGNFEQFSRSFTTIRVEDIRLEQCHGTQAAAFEEFTQYDTAHLPKKAEGQGKQKELATFLPLFVFDSERRALLRVDLDARYARLYGLTRDDLRYILDPSDLMGEDYLS